MKPFLGIALLLLASLCARAQAPLPLVRNTADGKAVPESASHRFIEDFKSWLLVTSDSDWEEKWDTPPDVRPTFTEATEVKRGGVVTLLIFISGPKPDRDQQLNVVCDLKTVRPDGSISIDMHDSPCLEGLLQGPVNSLRLSKLLVRFSADPGDLAGDWKFFVQVKDKNRGFVLPLSTVVKLVD
jgi:hypothetical protein